MPEKIPVLLVDDEPLILDAVEAMFAPYPSFAVVGKVTGKAEALRFVSRHAVQVAFLDIQMEGDNGFALADALHERAPEIVIVFLTGHAGFALEGYDHAPVDFLVKPVEPERFAQTLHRIESILRGKRPEPKPTARVGVYTESGFTLVDVANVCYLEKQDRKVRIVQRSGEALWSGASMQELEDIFSEYGFFRCHQSYLVPLQEVERIAQERFGRSYWLYLRGGDHPVPLSRRKYTELKELLRETDSPIYKGDFP